MKPAEDSTNISLEIKMGQTPSKQTPTENVFQKELQGINEIVNKIINENNTYRNKDYNFLSQDVCSKFRIVLESELQKHLKIHLSDFKSNIYVLPKEDTRSEENLASVRMTKSEICNMISNHYTRILYILCLVKYVYNLESNGDRSFGGIIHRNIKITDNTMEVMYCKSAQSDNSSIAAMTPTPAKAKPFSTVSFAPSARQQSKRVNLNKLDGFKFFLQYFLTKEESKGFIKLMRAILGRGRNKYAIKSAICECLKNKTLSQQEIELLRMFFERNFNEPFTCTASLKTPLASLSSHATPTMDSANTKTSFRDMDTSLAIGEYNPVFMRNFCPAIDVIQIHTNTREGQEALKMYNEMTRRYQKNIAEMEHVISQLVIKVPKPDGCTDFELVDMESATLDDFIERTKKLVRCFFLQSILDYQHLLDNVKKIPNVKVNIDPNGFV